MFYPHQSHCKVWRSQSIVLNRWDQLKKFTAPTPSSHHIICSTKSTVDNVYEVFPLSPYSLLCLWLLWMLISIKRASKSSSVENHKRNSSNGTSEVHPFIISNISQYILYVLSWATKKKFELSKSFDRLVIFNGFHGTFRKQGILMNEKFSNRRLFHD